MKGKTQEPNIVRSMHPTTNRLYDQHTFYTNKEIFLQELISNALEKISCWNHNRLALPEEEYSNLLKKRLGTSPFCKKNFFEGGFEFRSIIFVRKRAPFYMFEVKKNRIKLIERRVSSWLIVKILRSPAKFAIKCLGIKLIYADHPILFEFRKTSEQNKSDKTMGIWPDFFLILSFCVRIFSWKAIFFCWKNKSNGIIELIYGCYAW